MQLNFTYRHFKELTTLELYQILELRNQVFVVEQTCPYNDIDNRDQASWHLCGRDGENLAAYCRIMPAGVAYEDYCGIGRVVTSPQNRGKGDGRILMQEAIKRTYEQFGVNEIKIGAQAYLKAFYESLGFTQNGEGYLEDGIPHIPMVHKKQPE